MKVRLSDHFTFKKIFKATLAPMLMMVFISLYSIVDGIFISNFASKEAFAGVNLIFPIIMIIGGIGFMLGTGGSAFVSKLLGEKKDEEAHKTFTMTILFALIIGVIISISGALLVKPIALAMASVSDDVSATTIKEAIKYGQLLMLGQVFFILQNLYQSFFIVDEKPVLGFLFTLGAGILNMVLDLLFIAVFKWGIVGAALATILGYIVGGLGPTIYFLVNKNDYIRFRKTNIKFKPILQICFNGSSEFVNNISSSIVSIIFNIQLLRYFGEAGVNAYGIMMYLGFVFCAIFIGYSGGVAPIESYNYGANNSKELKNVLTKSLIITSIFSLAMFSILLVFANPLASLFASDSPELMEITTVGLRIYSFAFLMIGSSIYISTFFTALNNGLVSALISFLRTLVFQIVFVFTFPLFMGSYGIFYSILGSEIVSVILAVSFLIGLRKKYNY